jgi:hypothetical protein
VNIPFKIQLSIKLKEIADFHIVRFQDKKLQYPEPHWYVLIPTDSSHFLIAMITSQIAKRKEYYKRTLKPKAVDSLVKINNDDFSFLKREKDSVVECNQVEYLRIEEIIHRVEEEKGFKIEKEQVPTYLKKEVVSAINNSPIVKPFMKKLAIVANPI